MNKDRKILLIVLFVTSTISLSVINLTIIGEKHKAVKERIALVENNLKKIDLPVSEVSQIDREFYEQQIDIEKDRYFNALETDPFEFAIDIKSLLEDHHLNVTSYKSIENDDVFNVEFSVKGSSLNFFRFLEELDSRGKNYLFSQFTMKNEKQGISSVFRIGFVTNE